MTRPIKFRAWDKNRQEYVYEWKDGSAISAWFWQKHSDEEARFVFEQVTGLTDKNRKEIYEGDIVRTKKVNCTKCGDTYDKDFLCVWQQQFTRFDLVDESNAPYGWYRKEEMEVIGNKWENPDLLEAK